MTLPLSLPIYLLPHAEGLELPAYATKGASGMDLYAAILEPLCLKANMGRLCIPMGICIELPEGYEAQIRPRSGLAVKNGITVLNAPGTIDSDYRGEIKIPLINFSDTDFIIHRGMRVAQMVITQVAQVLVTPVLQLTATARAENGFGSTGI